MVSGNSPGDQPWGLANSLLKSSSSGLQFVLFLHPAAVFIPPCFQGLGGVVRVILSHMESHVHTRVWLHAHTCDSVFQPAVHGSVAFFTPLV